MGLNNLHWSQDTINSAGNFNQVKKQKQQQEQQQQQQPGLACPRCESTNTKFCYFNNYSKSQPRHFCKSCRRHWTNGGTLRNVPVGGGRKNKRSKTTTRTGSGSKDETVAAAAAEATGNVLVQNSQVLDIGNGMMMGAPPSSSSCSSYLENFIDPFSGSSFFSEWSAMNGGFHWSAAAAGDDHDPVLSSSGFVVGPGVMMPPMFGGDL
ncbi:hypothetical protein J5N97_021822 [Dioscorea zingiberensis]|uniref:Dof zinc finger protein n=1 Tax=Dioscorea zingiberensis TaxID=325984 RepID=A0A9D5CA19_9LILI|nr:hypothetical protein J5N97_021822 [Dioscorea zingiberensis]